MGVNVSGHSGLSIQGGFFCFLLFSAFLQGPVPKRFFEAKLQSLVFITLPHRFKLFLLRTVSMIIPRIPPFPPPLPHPNIVIAANLDITNDSPNTCLIIQVLWRDAPTTSRRVSHVRGLSCLNWRPSVFDFLHGLNTLMPRTTASVNRISFTLSFRRRVRGPVAPCLSRSLSTT